MNGGLDIRFEEPGERSPAPAPLRLVQRFVNSVDLEDGIDLLNDPAALETWLVAAGLLAPDGPRVTPAGHRRALALRDALRELAYANAGHEIDPAAAAVVNDAAARAGLRPVLTAPDSSALEPSRAEGFDAALGRIVAAVHAGIADGSWPRLKACDRDSCRWVFYDHSRNRSGHWCSMAVCGSREKNRRAYRRRATG